VLQTEIPFFKHQKPEHSIQVPGAEERKTKFLNRHVMKKG